MDKIENFLKEPSMEKLEKLRKSEIIKIGEKLELNVENSMRKAWTRYKNSKITWSTKMFSRKQY